MGDGTPWRPLIDVSDMAKAFQWALHQNVKNFNNYLVINVGFNDNNFSVMELAELVEKKVPNTKIEILNNTPNDLRSYKVDFSLFENLTSKLFKNIEISSTIENLSEYFENDALIYEMDNYKRLNTLKSLINCGKLRKDLRWNL